MKKHLIAAAVAAAVAVPAAAQVSVYGVFDLGYGTTKAQISNATQKQTQVGGRDSSNGNGGMSGSRLGFRGDEDLGGGLKASFVYEVGINPARNGVTETTGAAATPANAAFGNVRNGFVSLSGGFGSVHIGTLNTQVKDLYDAADPGGGNNFVGTLHTLYSTGREYGAIRYTTPNFSGFQVRASFTPSEVQSGAAVKADAGQSVSLTYAAGPLSVGAAQDVRKNVTLTASTNLVDILNADIARADAGTNTDKITQDVVTASYNLGVATVRLIQNKVRVSDATAADNGKVESTLVGLTAPFGATSLFASMSKGEHTDNGAKNFDFDGYQIGAVYTLSKRTNVYGVVAKFKADDVGGTTNPAVDQAQVGIRHSF